MPLPRLITYGTSFALLVLALQRTFLPELIKTSGIFRAVQPLSSFPAYSCRRLEDPRLESCEDLWIDDVGRKLYGACSSWTDKMAWLPAVEHLDAKGRMHSDHFVVLDLDSSSADFDFRTLKFEGYRGPAGEPTPDLHGFDVARNPSDGTLTFYAINHRAPSDGSDAHAVGANSSIEVFELSPSRPDTLRWKRTIEGEAVRTPNRVQALPDGGVVFTNDHKRKVGAGRLLEMVVPSGSLGYCPPPSSNAPSVSPPCTLATPWNLLYPNGVVYNKHDSHLYVPSSCDSRISVFRPPTLAHPHAELVDEIPVDMPMDNLSVDEEGVIWAAGFPKVLEVMKMFTREKGARTPSSVMRIEKKRTSGKEGGGEGGWEVRIEVEDKEGDALPFTTTAVRDVKTGRLFAGSPISPWIGVCDRL